MSKSSALLIPLTVYKTGAADRGLTNASVRTANDGNLLVGITDYLTANACARCVSSSAVVVSSCCIDLSCFDCGK